MSAHTPGPWQASKSGDWWNIESTDRNVLNPVAMVGHERDVSVLLAAPDMLAVLERVERAMTSGMNSDTGNWMDDVRRTIALAEGRGDD